jgi:hypothetical protein
MLALTAAEGTIVVSATGGVILAALLAFGFWWFKPFRSASRKELRMLDRLDGEPQQEHEHEAPPPEGRR